MSERSAEVLRIDAPGMITVKADLTGAAGPLKGTLGGALPGTRGIVAHGDVRVAWMAPDEVLVMVPRDGLADMLGTLEGALAEHHALVADVSDMRAMFRIAGGAAARETLAKLCPVDLAPGRFEPGDLRRTRLAQIPAAFWIEQDAFSLVCFRSVADYAETVLRQAAAPSGFVGYFDSRG